MDEAHTLTLWHGLLTHRRTAPAGHADATTALWRQALDGDESRLGELLGLRVRPDPQFPTVTQ